MKLTILGNNGPYPKAGGACSGYLLEEGETKVLIDCGNGVLSNFFKISDFEKLDAIILSHLHSDHVSDILVLKYAIGIKKIKGIYKGTLPLYTPMDDMDLVNRLNYNDSFEIIPIDGNKTIKIKDINIEFKKMIHPVETYSIKATNEKKIFVYSSDTSYNEELIDFAQNADLFLCESGILKEDKNEETAHLTPGEAGDIASKAKVKRLVLTHFWPEYRLDKILKEGKETFNSILELSECMKVYYI